MNKKLTKVITLILSCLLLIGAAVGITVSANAEGDTPSVEIVNKNVAYEGAVQLVFALKENNLENSGLTTKVVFGAEVALEADVDELANGYVKNVAGHLTRGEGETAVVYALVYSNGIVAKELRKAVVATPVLVDAEGVVKYVGASVEYSPYVYAMNRFDNAQNSAAQIELYKALLDYGAAVQDLLSDSYASLGFESKDAAITAWGGWADEYYNSTYVDEVLGYSYSYVGVRAAEVEDPLVIEADRLREGKIFKGFFNGEDQVYQIGTASSTWNKYEIKPGSKAMNVVATYEDGTNPYVQFATETALPTWVYLSAGNGNVQTDTTTAGTYGWIADGVYNVSKVGATVQHLYFNPVATADSSASKFVETNKAAAIGTGAKSVSYELDMKLNSAVNLRDDDVVLYFPIYSGTEKGRSNEDRPSALTNYLKNGYWNIESEWIKVGEWVNIRFEFTQHPTLPGYIFDLYVNGKLVNNYPEDSMLRATTGYSIPFFAIESRYPEHDGEVYTENTSDISYSVDNFRMSYELCTEHEWIEDTNIIYKKSAATCAVGSIYYKSCATCSFRGTETFELDDATGLHTPNKIPLVSAIKTDATASSPAEYYQVCSTCKGIADNAETYFYGSVDDFETGKYPDNFDGHLIDNKQTTAPAEGSWSMIMEENGNHYLNIQGYSSGGGNGEKTFIMTNNISLDCVDTVVYEFDYRYVSSSKYVGTSGGNLDIGYFYLFKADGTNNGRLSANYFGMRAASDGSYVTAFGKTFKPGEWHHIKIEVIKVFDGETLTGFKMQSYVDGAKAGAASAVAYTDAIPSFGFWSRYKANYSHDFDNVYVHADHELTEEVSESALKSEASCLAPALYYKTCAVCGPVHDSVFAVGEALPHSYKQIKSDNAIKATGTADSCVEYYESCENCGKLDTDNFFGVEHSFKNVVSAETLKSAATANAYAVYNVSCENCGIKTDDTFLGDSLDDFADGVMPGYYDKGKAELTLSYKSEAGRNYLNVYGSGERTFILDGDFDVNCVDTVTYEFDYRFGGSNSTRSDDNGIGWFYFFNPEYTSNSSSTHPNGSTYGRLKTYWAMTSNTRQNATSFTAIGKSFGTTDGWHTVKIVLTKTVTDGAVTGWGVKAYVDGVNSSNSSITGSTTYVPSFGIWGRGSVTYSHDFDNVRVYATHSGEVTETVNEATLHNGANCTGPAVYNKTCATCGIIHEQFLSGEATAHTYEQIVTDSALKSAATTEAPAVYYLSCVGCGANDTDSSFEYGYVDYLAKGEAYPLYQAPAFTEAPVVTDGVAADGSYNHIVNDDGNYVWRFENHGTTPDAIVKLTTPDHQPVANATKYVFGFDFRYNGGATYVKTGTDSEGNPTETTVNRAFLLRGPSATGVADKGGDGYQKSYWQWTATVGDNCLNGFFGRTLQVGEWASVRIEYVVNYTDDALTSYTAKVFVDNLEVWTLTLPCDTTGEAAYTNAPMFDIFLSGLCVKELSFDLDNFVYIVE